MPFKVFMCRVCGKKFSCASQLDQHSAVHTGTTRAQSDYRERGHNKIVERWVQSDFREGHSKITEKGHSQIVKGSKVRL